MRKFVLLLLPLVAAPVFGAVITGRTNEDLKFTGIGTNSQGRGESMMTWGDCAYNGTRTVCTLTGPYTAPGGASGTFSMSVFYQGNGPFPLIAVNLAADPNKFTTRADGQNDYNITLTPANGTPYILYSYANFSFVHNNGDVVCTGLPQGAACGLAAVGTTPGATMSGRPTLTLDTAATITANKVVTASAYGAATAASPGSWIEIYGANLATVRSREWTGADFNGNTAPTALSGSSVTIGGKPAFIYFVNPGQINAQVPSDVPVGVQPVVVTTAGGNSTSYSLTVNATQPGVLAPPSFVISGNQHIVALISGTLTYVLPTAVSGIATVRARSGDNITIYGVGFGTTTPTNSAGQIVQATNQLTVPIQVTIGGAPATITYQGLAPSYVGLYQFNVVVPNVAAGDAVPVVIRQGSAAISQSLVIATRN